MHIVQGSVACSGKHPVMAICRRIRPGACADRRNAAAVALSRLGASKGGRARAAALSAEERRAIAKKVGIWMMDGEWWVLVVQGCWCQGSACVG